MKLAKNVIAGIERHAEECYPKECCGVVIVEKGKRRYIPCKNIAPTGKDFWIDPVDLIAAEERGKVVMIVHSHCNISPRPTEADLIFCERSGVEWLIINWPTKITYQFKPSGFELGLYGREFNHGIVDCYAFVRDYYHRELGIELSDYHREDNWWLNGENHYLNLYEEAGFYQIDLEDLQKHDMIYMTVASQVPNHAAIYLGDGVIGHHQVNRLSSRDVYGGWFQKITTHIMRHKEV